MTLLSPLDLFNIVQTLWIFNIITFSKGFYKSFWYTVGKLIWNTSWKLRKIFSIRHLNIKVFGMAPQHRNLNVASVSFTRGVPQGSVSRSYLFTLYKLGNNVGFTGTTMPRHNGTSYDLRLPSNKWKYSVVTSYCSCANFPIVPRFPKQKASYTIRCQILTRWMSHLWYCSARPKPRNLALKTITLEYIYFS